MSDELRIMNYELRGIHKATGGILERWKIVKPVKIDN